MSTTSSVAKPDLVSAIITTRDRPDFLKQAVASVVAQTYSPLELIVVDDGSQVLVAGDMFGPLHDIPLRISRNDRSQGVSAARNLGARLAQGRWIAFLDDDDQWWVEKLRKQVACVKDSDTNFAGCGCLMKIYDDRRNLLEQTARSQHRAEIMANLIYRDENIAPSTLLFDRQKFLDSGGYREDMPVAEDCEFLLRFLLRHDFTVLPEPLVDYTEHKGARLTRNFAAVYEGEVKYRDFVIENQLQLSATKRDLGYRHAKVGHQAMLARKWLVGLRAFAAGLMLCPLDKRVFLGAVLSLLGPVTYYRVMSWRMERIR